MNTSSIKSSPRRLNVLTLDGGGVRGLSTLLILRELMSRINSSIQSKRPGSPTVEPHHIFHLVAGTSTGGLIAIMLGKLGMNIEDCIEAYNTLSSKVFGKKNILGKMTGGLAASRYSGERLERRVRKLLTKRNQKENLSMGANSNSDKIACALVCREHQGESRYSKFKRKAVCICSRPCPESPQCLICEAARATSAAPTYFPVQKINRRSFVDGGLEFNNPSHVIFDHYIKANRVSKSRRPSIATETGVQACHEDFVFSKARLINLGTGTDHEDPEALSLASPIPGFIRMAMFLRRELKKIAVDSERTADHMRSLSETAEDIDYVRFSADNGVCFIRLDKYRELDKIADLTSDYLSTARVQRKMRRLAEEVAVDYLASPGHATSDRLEVPETHAFRPETPVSQVGQSKSQQSSATKLSTALSRDGSQNSAQNTPSKASNSADTRATTPRSERRPESMSREEK